MEKHPLQDEIDKLPEEVRWRLQRADGFLDLRMPARAQAELGLIETPHCNSPVYREVSLRLAFEQKDWPVASGLADRLRSDFPAEPGYWIQLAYAKRRTEGIEVARLILIDAETRFPRIATIPFNLACYDCQLGHHADARSHLRRAFALDSNYRVSALEDEDLKPLWPELE